MTDEQVNYWADIYEKLRPFIRIFEGAIYWRPAQDIRFAPTFENFLALQKVKEQNTNAVITGVNKAMSDLKKTIAAAGKGPDIYIGLRRGKV